MYVGQREPQRGLGLSYASGFRLPAPPPYDSATAGAAANYAALKAGTILGGGWDTFQKLVGLGWVDDSPDGYLRYLAWNSTDTGAKITAGLNLFYGFMLGAVGHTPELVEASIQAALMNPWKAQVNPDEIREGYRLGGGSTAAPQAPVSSGPRSYRGYPQFDYIIQKNPNGVPGLYNVLGARRIDTYNDGQTPDPEIGPWQWVIYYNKTMDDIQRPEGNVGFGFGTARQVTDWDSLSDAQKAEIQQVIGPVQVYRDTLAPIPQPPPGSVVHIPAPGTSGVPTIKLPGSEAFVPITEVPSSVWAAARLERESRPDLMVGTGGVQILSNDPASGELVDVTPDEAGMPPLGILLIGGAIIGLFLAGQKKGRR